MSTTPGNNVCVSGAAEPLLAEATDLLRQALPETDPRLWRAVSDLGAALAGQGRWAEAEPQLLESAQRLMELLPAPSGTADEARDAQVGVAGEAAQRVIDLYDAWHGAEPGHGHDASARQWHYFSFRLMVLQRWYALSP